MDAGGLGRRTRGHLAHGLAHHAGVPDAGAGPGGGSVEKPVGTVFIALASRSHPEPVVEQHLFRMEREGFKSMAAQTALDLLRRRLIRML